MVVEREMIQTAEGRRDEVGTRVSSRGKLKNPQTRTQSFFSLFFPIYL